MLWYLTFNDHYSGIYRSQVIARLEFARKKFSTNSMLVVLVPWQSWSAQRTIFKSEYNGCIVIPQIGGIRFWWLSIVPLATLALFHRPRRIIGRSMFSTNLAISLRNLGLTSNVVYDGRGAESAEWEEYLGKAGLPISMKALKRLEARAIETSDFQLAVSKALIHYWRIELQLNPPVVLGVIPCTIASDFHENVSESTRNEWKAELAIPSKTAVILFSGSKGDWQSTNEMEDALIKLAGQDAFLIMLTNQKISESIIRAWNKRIIVNWVKPSEVFKYYQISDFGLLLRPTSTTNRVASPVKVGEYVASGLLLVTNHAVESTEEIIEESNCGLSIDQVFKSGLPEVNLFERERIAEFGRSKFKLDSYESLMRRMFHFEDQ